MASVDFGEVFGLLNSPAGWSVAASVATVWLKGRFDARAAAAKQVVDIQVAETAAGNEARRVGLQQSDMAFDHLKEVVETLREDIKALRTALAAETAARVAAEREVHELRSDIQRLQTALAIASSAPTAVILNNHPAAPAAVVPVAVVQPAGSD